MKWIGVTGGIGTGKSTVAKLLSQRGYPVVDADYWAKVLVQKDGTVLSQIVKLWGESVLTLEGTLDRAVLGKIVFQNSGAKKKLEELLHPLIHQKVELERKRLQQEGHLIAFYDVPLLFENGLEESFDAIICVVTTLDLQRQRLMVRNGWSNEEIEQRLRSQWPLEEKIKRSHFILQNQGTLEDLNEQLVEIVEKILNM